MKTPPYNTVSVYSTFPEFLFGLEGEYADRPALSWFTRRGEEQMLTYGQLIQKVFSLSKSLLQRGLPAGSHIALIGENSADWIVSFLAIAACGHVAVCVDTEQSDDNIRNMILRSDSRLVFLTGTFLPISLPLLESGHLSGAVLMGGLSSDERVTSLDALYERGAQLDGAPEYQAVPEQTAEIIFTSGTTSQSKMVMHTQKAILQNAVDASTYVCLHSRVFCSLPFYHAYGINTAVLNSFLQGCHLYINGNLKTTMRDLQLSKPDTMLTVPLMLEAIHNQIWLTAEKSGKAEALRKLLHLAAVCKKLHLPVRFKAFDGLREKISSSLRLIICGGAHLSREIAEEFELFGIQVLQGYGITEYCPLISVNRNCSNKLGSVGQPMLTAQVRIVDEEICVRGPSVMEGYYKDPEQTAQALSDGWFKTGDLGTIDKDGFLYITGRKKNLIVFRNGKKVSPETLEELIATIPMVKEVLVTGTTNGVLADDVKLTASIYPDPARTVGMSSYEILAHLQQEVDRINNTLPSYQQIRLVNIREKEFSKTGTRKIKRHGN